MANRASNSSLVDEKESLRETISSQSIASITIIPVEADGPRRIFQSSIGSVTIGRSATVEPAGGATSSHNTYTTFCPVVSRKHAIIRWLTSGEVALMDAKSHHGTYINESPTRLTPGQAYKLHNEDTISFGKGIFKDGQFHPPHTVAIHFNAAEEPTTRNPSGTYGLRSQPLSRERLGSVGSQSEVTDRQADRIRTEVQRLGRRREVAGKHRRQLHDVSKRLEYLEKNALDRTTSPQEVELRLRALERHYEGLLDKLTIIEQSVRNPSISGEAEPRRHVRRVVEDGEETDDDEPTGSSRSSLAGTVAMVLVGGAVVWTALAMG
ncbi:hypothetical protein FRC15_006062 [Serendipita sp. 397]|nr:hypothetical protein FRC15_006062 [Serendipita sp. 397]